MSSHGHEYDRRRSEDWDRKVRRERTGGSVWINQEADGGVKLNIYPFFPRGRVDQKIVTI